MSVSLDGFVSDREDGWDRVLAWYSKPQPPRGSEVDPDRDLSELGVIVAGRRTFEVANGWGGQHPTGAPVIVLTHSIPADWPRPGSTVVFNTEGIESAIEQAREIADGKDIALASPKIIQQCLDRGLVDRLQVSVVPLLLGSGIRLFENLAGAAICSTDRPSASATASPTSPTGCAKQARTRAPSNQLPQERILDWSLEVVVLPVGDIDRSVAFYRDQVGFQLDHDTRNEHMHVVQLTPPGSGCSIVFGDLPAQNQMPPGSMKALQLVVSDAAAARRELVDRGIDASELMVVAEADGGTFFGFQDPDGNPWTVQEIKARATKPLIPTDRTGLSEWAGR